MVALLMCLLLIFNSTVKEKYILKYIKDFINDNIKICLTVSEKFNFKVS